MSIHALERKRTGGDVDISSECSAPNGICRRISDEGIVAFLISADKNTERLLKGKKMAAFDPSNGLGEKICDLVGKIFSTGFIEYGWLGSMTNEMSL
jgi:hypothetical protein